MSNRARKADKGMSGQPVLFDSELSEGMLDVSLGFKQCLSRAISISGKDRYQIGAEISRATQRDISREMLDKYTSSDPAYRLPAEILPAFCHVTVTLEPFRYLLDPLGSDVLNPADKDLIELARLQEEERKIQTRIMQIRVNRGIK